MKFTKDDLNQTMWAHPNAIVEDRKRYIVDASGKTLGKLAVEIARKLAGKDKAYYCEQWDCGDYIVVTNVEKIHTTGNKLTDKKYYKHTWWKGHLREITLGKLIEKDPKKVIELAVKGMLPKNKLRKPRLKRLKLFAGSKHPYEGQNLLAWDSRSNQQIQQQQ